MVTEGLPFGRLFYVQCHSESPVSSGENCILAMNWYSPNRHCEERSDAAIHEHHGTQAWIDTACGLAMTK